jgi:hypothetical protein
VRHTPDAARAALDDLFEARLRGETRPVDVRLRDDLRLRVTPAGDGLRVAFRLRGREPRSHLRDGSDDFLATYASEVDDVLRAWGVAPPDRYALAEGDGGWDVYAATVGG